MEQMDVTVLDREACCEPDDDEPEVARPSAYPLDCNQGRCGFLESYMWFGEEALFEAVAHIWDLLEEPKSARCIHIGLLAGTGGSGKWALAKFLRHALREALDYEEPQPRGHWFDDIHQFHQASMDYFAADFAHYQRTVQKYADILVGEPGRHSQATGEVILGPWLRLTSYD